MSKIKIPKVKRRTGAPKISVKVPNTKSANSVPFSGKMPKNKTIAKTIVKLIPISVLSYSLLYSNLSIGFLIGFLLMKSPPS